MTQKLNVRLNFVESKFILENSKIVLDLKKTKKLIIWDTQKVKIK